MGGDVYHDYHNDCMINELYFSDYQLITVKYVNSSSAHVFVYQLL